MDVTKKGIYLDRVNTCSIALSKLILLKVDFKPNLWNPLSRRHSQLKHETNM